MTKKKELTLSTVLVKQKELLESSVDDEIILLSMAKSKYYGMDPVAGRIWELLDNVISIQDIITVLMDEFEVSRIDCENDVMLFLNNLIEEHLVDLSQ